MSILGVEFASQLLCMLSQMCAEIAYKEKALLSELLPVQLLSELHQQDTTVLFFSCVAEEEEEKK